MSDTAQGRVLFGQSYFLRFDPKLWKAGEPFAPLGTLLAASYLRERGYDVALFDSMLADSESEWEAALARHRPRWAVLYEDNFNYLSKMCLLRMREAAFKMIGAAQRAGASVLVCGSDATDHAEKYLAEGARFVLNGEGEATLGELMDRLAGRTETPFEEIAGLAFGREDGSGLQRTAPRGVLRDLDALPLPAWDLVEVERYRRFWLERHGHFAMNMVTTRGCPYHCNWCAKPIWGQTYHMRSPAHVAEELGELREKYRPDRIWFCDDIMGLKRGWMEAFAEEVERRGARTPFKCLSRADLLLREGEIDALRRAGNRVVWIGAESGSQKILDAMDKGTRIEQIYEASRRMHEAGLRIGFFLQFGYPGESREDVELTRKMVRECRPDEIGISVSYPLPGTKFYDMVKAELGDKQNWVDSEDLDMMYRGPFTTAFYRQLWRVLTKEFRSRLAADELAGVLRRPVSVRPRHLRRLAALGYHQASLPFERLWLERQARRPHRGIGPLRSGMSPDEAARPTPQGS